MSEAKLLVTLAVVVAQLVQWSAVRIRSSANFYIEPLFIVNCMEKTKIKENRGLEWPINFFWSRDIKVKKLAGSQKKWFHKITNE